MGNLLKRPSHSRNKFKKPKSDVFWERVITWIIYTIIIAIIAIITNM